MRKTITPTEYNQIYAALTFWKEVAERAAVHPSRHPAVKPLFDGQLPLTVAEIEDLLNKLSRYYMESA